MPTYVDLSHSIHDGMVTYPGLPPAELGTVLSREDSRDRYAPGVEFHIGTARLCSNTGTWATPPAIAPSTTRRRSGPGSRSTDQASSSSSPRIMTRVTNGEVMARRSAL